MKENGVTVATEVIAGNKKEMFEPLMETIRMIRNAIKKAG